MADVDPFSMSTMLDSLQELRSAAGARPVAEEYPAIPPPQRDDPPLINLFPGGFCAASTPQELEMRLRWTFDLMTNNEGEYGVAPFKHMISRLDSRELWRMASFLTSDSDYFLDIARNKNGSNRLQILLGKSDDVDAFFAAAILHRFLHVLTNRHASYVAIQGMRVFDDEKKEAMYAHTLHHALLLACDKHGCIALNEVITDLDHPFYRNELLGVVVLNALLLSNDAYGNFVIQHVLKLNDLRCTFNIAVNLRGHFVDLSFKKYGSYIIEKLLDAKESMVVVVEELLECNGDRLMRLARSEYGNFVVGKALRVTQNKMIRAGNRLRVTEEEMIRANLFRGLVHKLMPFLHLLRRSRGTNIAAILDSIH